MEKVKVTGKRSLANLEVSHRKTEAYSQNMSEILCVSSLKK